MNVFFRELKAYRMSTIIWTVSLSLLLVTFLSLYPSFSNDVESMKKILANLPPMVKSGIGLSMDTFFSIYGFVGYLLTFAMLAGSIQAMNLGVNIFSKEESGKTADFLITKPISRANIFINKLLAAVTVLLITNIYFCSVAVAMAVIVSVGDFNLGTLILVLLKMALVQLIFLSIGILTSLIVKKIKSSIAISLPIVFGLFATGMIGAILEIDEVKYISPFKFFDAEYIINNNSYEIGFLIAEALIVAFAIVVSFIIFTKKDIGAAS